MKKIVDKPIKIDLHIHSFFSNHKDGKKVAFNTEENIPVLIAKLRQNEIDMCAITDHDRFSLDLYKTLKSYEGKELLKVLPGVEFSVKFDGKKVIHIVTIFDDKDEEGLKRLEESFVKGIGKEKYIDGAYERDDYFAILKEVGLDDFIKVWFRQNKGLSAWQKIVFQTAVALIVAIFAYKSPLVGDEQYLPITFRTFSPSIAPHLEHVFGA